MKKLMLSLGFIVTLSFGINIQDAQTAFKNGDFESAYKMVVWLVLV